MSNVFIPQEIWDQEVTANNEPFVSWIWEGIVAPGNLTLLTSQWKAGKTTLVSMLLTHRKTGAPLAGFAVKPGKTLIVTEEPKSLWAERLKRYDFGGKVCFISRPFLTIPSSQEWRALIERILQLQSQHGIDLLVIDPLAPYLRAENHAKCVLEALLPLRELTDRDMAVLTLHHPGKGERRIGQAARGSGALLGHADIIVEMRHPGGDPHTRRRRFLALSRHQQTPARLLLELNADATDYVPAVETESASDDFSSKWEVLRIVLEDATQKLTRRDILLEWPEDFDHPDPATLSRWLNRALACQSILRDGTGHKNDPFRYCLPEKEAEWQLDPLYQAMEQQRIQLKLPFQSLHPSDREKPSEPNLDTE